MRAPQKNGSANHARRATKIKINSVGGIYSGQRIYCRRRRAKSTATKPPNERVAAETAPLTEVVVDELEEEEELEEAVATAADVTVTPVTLDNEQLEYVHEVRSVTKVPPVM